MAEFDEFADDYEQVLNESIRWSRDTADYFAAYKAVAARALGWDELPRKILDFGCGVGGVTRHLARAFPDAQLDGFDVSQESVDALPEDLRGRGEFSSDLTSMADDYDLILIANVLHHIEPAERADVMRDLGRRLRSGGRLLVFEHNPLNPVTRWIVATCPFDENAVLLWPSETLGLLRHAELRHPRRQFVLFFPGFLRALRFLEPNLGWLPAGAQYMA